MKGLLFEVLVGSVLLLSGCATGPEQMSVTESDISVRELRCEYLVNPLGIDVTEPRLSWVLHSGERGQRQTAYQIMAASDKEKLAQGKGDLWDTGKVESSQSIHVEYAGKELGSAGRCFWKVRCWDKDGSAGSWSETASFEMALLEAGDWQGVWIGAERTISAPLLRKEFEIAKEINKARVYISGLGFSELYINGGKVGDHVLDPAATDYNKTVLYVTYDITDLLKKGTNAVAVMLGNGWFSEPGYWKYANSPRLLMQMNIDLVDGSRMSVKTDETWKVSSGPIIRNDFYGGETVDGRLECLGWKKAGYDDSNWGSTVIKASPGGKLVSQLMPAIKVNQTIKPIKITNPKPGVYVYDMGQFFGGWARVHVKGPEGAKIAIRYSSRIFEDSRLIDQRRYRRHHWLTAPTPVSNETDVYILKGDADGETYEPRFTYHPVRYVQIEEYPPDKAPKEVTIENVEGRVVYSAVDMSGHFQCSNPLLNQIHKNVVWTLTNELFGFPLDCLHREHWGWIDPATVTGTLYTRKHMPLFWTKWLNDVRDSQGHNGQVPNVVPDYAKYSSEDERTDPAWGGNYPLLVWYLHQYFGDNRILEEHYSGMKKLVDYFTSTANNFILFKGSLGDHMLPGRAPGREQYISKETPPPLVWTGYYYRGASIVAQTARILGKSADAERYAQLAENIKNAFNDKWLNTDTSQYAGGSQTANFFPLALGIVPKANEGPLVKNIVKDIVAKHNGHLYTGNTGTTCMIDTLTDHGFGDVMYKVATKTTYPGWGYMVARGATTIWEKWGFHNALDEGAESMIMWCTVDEFFYNDLAGIRGPDYYGPGYRPAGFGAIEIRPYIPGDLTYAGASIKTVRGMVSSSWKKENDSLTLEVTIPVNSQAEVSVPKIGASDVVVTESGKTIWNNGDFVRGVSGIYSAAETDDYVTFNVGSGTYSFWVTGN